MITALMNNGKDMEHEAIDILMASVDAVYDLLAKSEAGKEIGQAHEIVGRIGRFLSGVAPVPSVVARPALSEYQELQVQEALKAGRRVYVINVGFDPRCKEKSVAALMVMQNLANAGSIIASVPDPANSDLNEAKTVTFFFSSGLDAEAVKKEAFVAGMTVEVLVREWEERARKEAPAPQQPVLSVASSRNEMLRIDASRVDLVMDLVGELIIGRSMIEQITRDMAAGVSSGRSVRTLKRRELLHGAHGIGPPEGGHEDAHGADAPRVQKIPEDRAGPFRGQGQADTVGAHRERDGTGQGDRGRPGRAAGPHRQEFHRSRDRGAGSAAAGGQTGGRRDYASGLSRGVADRDRGRRRREGDRPGEAQTKGRGREASSAARTRTRCPTRTP